MPLGNTTGLQVETIAEADNNKYLIVNDGFQDIDDAMNQILSVDLTSGNHTLTETETTRNGIIQCNNASVARTVFIPVTVGGGPPVTTNRRLIFHNTGSATVTIDHTGAPGTSVALLAGKSVGIFADGTNIIAFDGNTGGFALDVQEEGGSIDAAVDEINFTGPGVTVTTPGAGRVVVDIPGINVIEDTNANRNCSNGDLVGNVLVEMNNASANTYTVVTGLTGEEPVTIIQKGAGQTEIVQGASTTLQSASGNLKITEQYAAVTIIPLGSNVYYVIGSLTA